MKRYLILLSLCLALSVGTPAFSADFLTKAAAFDKGLAAAKSGDFATALEELKPLAEQGYSPAQSMLGGMYSHGQGTIQDYTRAHMWFNISSSLGDKDARRRRNRLATKMTPTQIETAQRLARECVQKNYKGC